MSTPRQFLVPKALVASLGDRATLDDLEPVSYQDTPAGGWARKVLARENSKLLDEVLGTDEKRLPRGVIADPVETGGVEVVTALVDHQNRTWTPAGWGEPVVASVLTVDLDDSDVAYVVRALREGATGVVLRPTLPVAFVSAAVAAPLDGAATGLPDGSQIVAIVDSLDRDAVLEELAVAPGPVVYRRHDGSWQEDDGWVAVLKSVTPPPMVKLDEKMVASVTAQVDQATAGQMFSPLSEDDADVYRPVHASAYVEGCLREADQRAIDLNLALVAVAGRELSPKDVASTEKLRRYWLYGEGAAKVRWYTPGAWRRCYRHLVKYLGPRITPGYCTNLSQRLGGHGIATHVGESPV